MRWRAVALAVLVWGTPAAVSANHDTPRAAGTVRAASELDYPPFAVTGPQGQADGFAVELMRAALRAMSREVQFTLGPWHAIKQDLAAGRIQALPLVARTAARDELFDFSIPYLSMHGVIVVRKGERRIRSSADLHDKAVLVMQGDIAEEYVRSHHLSERIVTAPTVAEALQRLAGGEQDAAVMQKLVAQNLLDQLGLDDLVLLDPPLDDYQTFSFAVRQGDSDLLALLNEGLALVVADGTYDKLRRKWLVPLPGGPSPILPTIAAVLLALLLAAAVAYLWQRSLRRMVRLRTAELVAANARLAEGDALRESEERLRLAAQAAHFGTFDFLLQPRELRVSDELKAIVGLPPEADIDLGEDGLPAFVHPADRGRVLVAVRAARAPSGARPLEDEHRIVRPDGTVRWVRLTGKLLPAGEAGGSGPARVVGTLVDITERREAEARRKRAEEALREREADLRRAQTVGQIGSWRLDVLRNELHWSDENYRIFGIAPGTPQSYDSFLACVHPDDRAYVDGRWQAALQGEPYDIEHRIVVAGEVRWVRERAELEFGADGALVGGFGTTQEVTERKRAEQALQESEATLRTLFANLPGVAYRCEVESPWRLSVISEAVLQVTGHPAAEFLREGGRTWGELVAVDDLPQVEAAVAEGVRDHRPYEVEYRIVHADGGLRWVFEKGRAVYSASGKPRWLDGVIVDISERKRAEAALARKSEELQRTNAELEEFAYVASHDLKAPLRAVANLALVIDEDAAAALDEENRRRLRMLRERVIGMDRLIDGLLGYARLGRAARDRRPVPLGPLLDDVVASLNLPSGFRVEREGPLPAFMADPLELRQVFQNLIANAIHHHDRASGTVWVRACREGSMWCVEVADDGPGIPPRERQQVFRMFSSDGKQGHFGIGLAAARKLVLANGGRIEVTENRPRGALFRVFWPE